jgi:hypothetical protein
LLDLASERHFPLTVLEDEIIRLRARDGDNWLRYQDAVNRKRQKKKN